MDNRFFEKPILNSPYEYPARHWELNDQGHPTQKIIEKRRSARFITPIPKPKKRKPKGAARQQNIVFDEGRKLSTQDQQYDPTPIINDLRRQVNLWRSIPNPKDWKVTPETARLLRHWRHHRFSHIRPFFCQVEAVETAIWLTEVAPKSGKSNKGFLDHLADANNDANPALSRLALKLAMGAGKTTVMAMLIAWQTINKVRRPNSRIFTRGFLVVAPGLTIRDRLRVLQPNDPDSYYQSRELVPGDMLADLERAKIVITNYHAFRHRERMALSKGGRSLLQGRGDSLNTLETEGQMLQRVMPDLMGMKNIMAINDEAHHCYREKPGDDGETSLKGDEKKEAQKNNEAARLWISGLEAVSRKIGINWVMDLSATPFFLRGSGYAEGTLFPWTMSDFSLMDAIESGIVKLPRVPVADNIPGGDMPRFRNLWEHIRTRMPKKGRGKAKTLDPLSLPVELQTALEALYGHYRKTFEIWEKDGIRVPPCFIVVCNNTSTSKLVYDYIAGFHRKNGDGTPTLENGRLELFRNFDGHGNPLARPNTLLIDSEQLETGDALDKNFRNMAADEIERFRYEMRQRGEHQKAEHIADQDLLREVMNTVGKEGRLGESVRCVVSVSMLTEGWDANTVTHVLGVRAFGTQLLCEQVIGRALRRQSYDLNEEGLFNAEYADVLGIPFDFTAKPVISPPQPPRETIQVRAVRPERDGLEIRFPRVRGYRVELPGLNSMPTPFSN
ncbi:restriction endonuclease [Desulfonema ishimotonii]|uniref:Restriction endonuclease n=1 Tax=Desulfonema ishimotonii TaxID=45657 RepID=A0A401FYD9_9BACT|nr:DEAD/DEAH box helicase family protein [Desulfonema ishimotonii]GBC61964.1 restriction endonuclease [Desulfonema ishimotonii]